MCAQMNGQGMSQWRVWLLGDPWEALPHPPSALSPPLSCLVPTVWDRGCRRRCVCPGASGPDSTPSSSFCVMLAVELTERSLDI